MTTWNRTHVGEHPAGLQWLRRQVRSDLDVSVAQTTVETGRSKLRRDLTHGESLCCTICTHHISLLWSVEVMKPNRVVHAGMGGERITLDSKLIGSSKSTFWDELWQIYESVFAMQRSGRAPIVNNHVVSREILDSISIMPAKRPTKQV